MAASLPFFLATTPSGVTIRSCQHLTRRVETVRSLGTSFVVVDTSFGHTAYAASPNMPDTYITLALALFEAVERRHPLERERERERERRIRMASSHGRAALLMPHDSVACPQRQHCVSFLPLVSRRTFPQCSIWLRSVSVLDSPRQAYVLNFRPKVSTLVSTTLSNSTTGFVKSTYCRWTLS